ncbi:BMP family ABC transporter substrate-binding protein [Amycolatopsis pithecellobii]|uniref:BMP family ABC transporter substrate-binding protein n=1 Tax=Amycolatopsis pithecellobii TaxID=664692 RepID=A0A6N7Z0C9_9PSEU|nr:BMP family ABC transporter substrate-binding protein [Amycolatopsis pithecellobii]MTD53020.1 BMP family ABC transporter substrate-binding protein [Amycolatopsis pithecellobii]
MSASRRAKSVCALAVVAVATACGAPPSGGAAKAGDGPTGCLVADTAGINDGGFNALAWGGMKKAEKDLGAKVRFLQARSSDDYATNINAFVKQGCDLIVTVGFRMADATKAASAQYPDAKFVIVDNAYDPALPNVRGTTFATDQGAFLAGYAAASASHTGKVGTFGGVKISPVESYMDGFARGAAYYGKQTGKDIQLLGWSIDRRDGTFIGDFNDQEKAKQITRALMQQGADVIYPVASGAAVGGYSAIKDNGNGVLGIKGDIDGCTALPDYCGIFLTSALKNVDAAVFEAMTEVRDKTFKGSTYVGTLKNDGTGIGPFGQNEGRVPPQAREDLKKIADQLKTGELKTGSPFTVAN